MELAVAFIIEPIKFFCVYSVWPGPRDQGAGLPKPASDNARKYEQLAATLLPKDEVIEFTTLYA